MNLKPESDNLFGAINKGLWPLNKELSSEPGDQRIEEHGWNRFYIGKNADLYFIPGIVPHLLMVRTDRTSVFDIPLDLIIEGKGEIQNQISLFGGNFARDFGINVTISDELPDWFPDDLKKRSQIVEMCKPLTLHDRFGLELIFRNYNTGSFFKALQKGEDPYWLFLDQNLEEWHKFDPPVFTPTTKGVKDVPIPTMIVETALPVITRKLFGLFGSFSQHAYNNGFVVVDTKFEVFIDFQGNWVLGDEILTPESSRFIPREKFKQGIYESADKQIIRNIGIREGWKEQAKNLQPGEVLNVTITDEEKQQVIAGYQSIYNALNI